MKTLKKHYIPILSSFLTALFLFSIMLIKKVEPFGASSLVNYDCESQVYPLLCTLHDKLRSGASFFYSWRAGLGDGFLPTYFYYLSSPINLLVAFIDKGNIRAFINITIFLRLVFAASFFSIFLSKRVQDRKKEIYIIPFSIAYSLSSFVFGFYHESMWLDSYMIFPLIMYGYDRMIRDKKPAVYILSLVYSSLCSFYMTFIIGAFLVLWCILDEYKSVKEFGKRFVLFGVSSVLAVGMTFLSLIVSYLGVMKTHVENEPDIVHGWFGNIFNIIRYQFPFSTPIDISYSNNCANIYSGLFTVCLVFVYIFIRDIKPAERIKRMVLILFMLVSMNETILNFIWHGFHYQLCIPNRFAYIYIFLMLVTAFEALHYTQSVKRTVLGLILAEVFPLVCYFFVEYDSLIGSKKALIVSIVSVLIYSALIILQMVKKRILCYATLSVVMIGELFANAYFSLSYDLSEAPDYNSIFSETENLSKEMFASESEPFYRSKLVGIDQVNTGYILGLNGNAIYNSMINSDVLRFSERYGIFRTDVAIDENGGYEPLDDILGIKYLYTATEPFLSTTDYEKKTGEGSVIAYKNNNALPLGYGVASAIKDIKADPMDVIGNINRLSSSMTGIGNILKEVFPKYDISAEGYGINYADNDYLYIQLVPDGSSEMPYARVSFDVSESGLYNMYLNYSDYGIFSIYVNNEPRRYEETSFGGVLNLGKLEEKDKVDIILQSDNSMANGFVSASYPELMLRLSLIDKAEYERFHSVIHNNEMNISALSDGKIKADVSLNDGQILFTSIPYDDGWHVYEDGREIAKSKVAETFIGLELGEGEHSLEFKFVPEGFYLGLIVTIVSWILCFIWVMIYHHKLRIPKAKKITDDINTLTDEEITNESHK